MMKVNWKKKFKKNNNNWGPLSPPLPHEASYKKSIAGSQQVNLDES